MYRYFDEVWEKKLSGYYLQGHDKQPSHEPDIAQTGNAGTERKTVKSDRNKSVPGMVRDL